MAKIVKFVPKEKVSPETIQLCKFSDEIDAVVKHYYIDKGLDLKDLVGILSHRLGTMLQCHKDKERLWEICHEVLIKQASIKQSS